MAALGDRNPLISKRMRKLMLPFDVLTQNSTDEQILNIEEPQPDGLLLLYAAIEMMMASEQSTSKPETKEKKTRKRKRQELGPIPEMPGPIRDRIEAMGASKVHFIIEKQLKTTDLSKEHGRFLMPPNKVRSAEFLTEEEKMESGQRVGKSVAGMSVSVIGPSLREKTLKLKKWLVGSECSYIFTTGWNEFVAENGLAVGQTVRVWSVRSNEEEGSNLRFCFVKVQNDGGSDGGSSSHSSGDGSCLTEDAQKFSLTSVI